MELNSSMMVRGGGPAPTRRTGKVRLVESRVAGRREAERTNESEG